MIAQLPPPRQLIEKEFDLFRCEAKHGIRTPPKPKIVMDLNSRKSIGSRLPVLFLTGVLLAGCSSVEPGRRLGGPPLESLKTAYIVIRPDYAAKIGWNIQEALIAHGVTSTTGSLQAKPADVDFYVEYEDHWLWDLTMYLASLNIRFIENSSGHLIGSGAFRNGLFHTFPNEKAKTIEVVESIYKAK